MQHRIHGNPARDYASEWRAWRMEAGMSQPQLAKILDIARRTVINIENGHTRPRLSSRMKFQELKNKYQKEKSWQQQQATRNL